MLKDDNQNEWKELGTQETMVRANKIVADSLNVSLTLSCQCCNKVYSLMLTAEIVENYMASTLLLTPIFFTKRI